MAFFVKWCSKIKRPQTIEPEAYLRRKILKLTRQSERESHHKDGHTKKMSELFTRSLVLVVKGGKLLISLKSFVCGMVSALTTPFRKVIVVLLCCSFCLEQCKKWNENSSSANFMNFVCYGNLK
ncbi:hypothetical protein CDAR_216351 [Caerostris darwini]|uniref:Uncharacterized protein n=1 Tax=Caerostris darwini TaxID=1538125 RepID=A0AAV4SNH4_9ARAC|nr:hypothetical protein CDAR_216351 [Caerostris darwini]